MTQIDTMVAIGTSAALLAIVLALLRIEVRGRRMFLALTRRWVAASPLTAGCVVGVLSIAAAASFAHMSPIVAGHSAHATASSDGGATAIPELDQLRAYASEIGTGRSATSPASQTAGLPDVNDMIAKLAARLEVQPDDVKGWKMLGWSYLNTERPGEAARAYETALKLAPGDPEIQKALDLAKAAQSAPDRNASSGPERESAEGEVPARKPD